MKNVNKVLIVGGGIAGLSLAIGLNRRGIQAEIVEVKENWTVYGVGIIIQSNVIRAMHQLGILDKFMADAYPFENSIVYLPNGHKIVHPSARLAGPDYPPNMGIARIALHKVLVAAVEAARIPVRLGVTLDSYTETQAGVSVHFTDGTTGDYDVVVGADGTFSKVRSLLFPAIKPQFTGQAVWRYNFKRQVEDLTNFIGPKGLAAGLCPLSEDLMYMYVTSFEPDKPRYEEEELAEQMRIRLDGFTGLIAELKEQITDNKGVVYRPMQVLFVPDNWYRGRVILIGDAAHSTTPHMGQGAGISVEDALVLAEELAKDGPLETKFERFMDRRYARCKAVCDRSEQIGMWEMSGVQGDRAHVVDNDTTRIGRADLKLVSLKTMSRFDNKVCVVTGAGSGIGRATALAFAREGARVLVTDVNTDAGEAVVAEIAATGGTAIFLSVNIANQQQVEAVVTLAVERFGRLDCAVNCAGVTGGISAPTHEYPDASWAQNLAVNLTGTWYCMKAELTQMLKQGSGTIVNVASAAGLKGHPNNIGYCATKHAIVGMTKTAALEYATKNIRVNALCPSAIETPMIMDGRLNLRNNPELRAKFTNDQAMKRMGRPDEVADVALWLCSDQSTFITGHAMAVDGGMFA